MTTIANGPVIATPKPAPPASLMHSLTGEPDPTPVRAHAANPITWFDCMQIPTTKTHRVVGPMLNAGDVIETVRMASDVQATFRLAVKFRLFLTTPQAPSDTDPPIITVLVPTHSVDHIAAPGAPVPMASESFQIRLDYRHTGPRGHLALAVSSQASGTIVVLWWIVIRPNPA